MQDNLDQEFLTILQRHEPASVQELCEATGVTTTAIRQRLLRLQSQGLVSRQLVRQERGRPHHLYAITPAGLRMQGSDESEVAAVLWREVMRIDQPEIRNQVLTGVKNALVERFGKQSSTESLSSRLKGMCADLSAFGFDIEYCEEQPESTSEADLSIDAAQRIEASQRSLPVLVEHNCPYHEIASEDPSFCELEQSVFSEILGAPVELSACRLDGHRCCEFQVGDPDQF